MSDPKTRRFFLGALTAASAVRVWGANDKVNVGIVGLGGRGSSHLNTYTGLNEAQVVALCDVNQAAREKAQATLSRKNLEKAREFEDMRQMFADPKVEAVSIATPNHWHACLIHLRYSTVFVAMFASHNAFSCCSLSATVLMKSRLTT